MPTPSLLLDGMTLQSMLQPQSGKERTLIRLSTASTLASSTDARRWNWKGVMSWQLDYR